MSSGQNPTPLRKPYSCSKCTRSFATRKSLKSHGQDTGHGFPCIIPYCNKVFVSDDALKAHRSSPAHVTNKVKASLSSKTVVKTSVASPLQHPTKTKIPTKKVPCTLPGCGKVFETSAACLQHQKSPFHAKKKTVAKKDETTKAVVASVPSSLMVQSLATQLVATVKPEPAQSEIIKKDDFVTNQAGNHVMHQGGAVQASRSIQHPPAQDTVSTNPGPLFRWDARWSSIPTTAHASILIGLQARLPTPEVCASMLVDKKFWTPDRKGAPAQVAGTNKRRAIALDCEMVGVGPKGSISELARLSAIDFLTGELLIDTLVQPLREVTDWRTKWSGIAVNTMNAALASGDILNGSTAARNEIFKYMDSQTILVGHALHYDLEALGIRHEITVDSSRLAKAAVGKKIKRDWGLKTLCKELLNIAIQDNEKDGHDAVEDALAAREVVLWCLQHEKELKAWGARKKKEIFSNGKRGTGRQVERRRPRAPRMWYDEESDDYEYRSLSLAEFNELCGYPEWYDNWSD